MKISFIKRVDRLLGPWILVPLLIFRKLLVCVVATPPLKEQIPRKVVILKFWGMGSILLSLSAIEALKKKYPETKVTILTLHQNKELCELIPLIDEVLCLKLNGMLRFFYQTIGLLKKVRNQRFDIIIDLEFFSYYTAIFTLLSGICFRIGFASTKILRNQVYLKKVPFDHSRHISAIFMKVIEYVIGKENNNLIVQPSCKFQFKKEYENKIEEILSKNNIRKEDLVIIMNINASALSLERRWPRNNYLILAQRLLENYAEVRIILIGSHSERAYTTSFLEELKNRTTIEDKVVSLCGKISIGELITLFQRVDLFIGNDSGPLHLASFLDVPTVSFFGPETPLLYGPIGDKHSIFYEALSCSPCLNVYNYKSSFCKNNICLKDIDTDKVFEVIGRKYLQPMLHRDF